MPVKQGIIPPKPYTIEYMWYKGYEAKDATTDYGQKGHDLTPNEKTLYFSPEMIKLGAGAFLWCETADLFADGFTPFGAGEWAISFWIRLPSAVNVIDYDYGLFKTLHEEFLLTYNTYTLQLKVITPNGVISTTQELHDDSWHLIIAMRDSDNYIHLFVDNVEKGTPVSDDTEFSDTRAYIVSGIQWINESNAPCWAGIDDIRIFVGTDLSSAQRSLLWNNGAGTTDSIDSAETHWWKFDDGTTADSAGNCPLDAPVTNGTLILPKFGSAYYINFDAVIRGPECSYNPDFNFGERWALSFWVSGNFSSGVTYLFGKYSIENGGWKVYVNHMGGIGILLPSNRTFETEGILIGGWHHVVIQAEDDGYLRIYVDGVLVYTGSDVSEENYNQESPFTFTPDNLGGFCGIQDLRIFPKRSLSNAEIAWLYNEGNGRQVALVEM